jgi:DNA-directed RNA polymerase beta subunit
MPELMKEISFGKLDDKGMAMPHLLDIQTRAFEALLQLDAASHDREDIGLERVFKDLFPITDVHENFSLEFVRYTLGDPKYTVEECIERDMTYSAPLKATLQLVINEEVNGVKRPRNIIEKEVYLGELPLLTPLGTFVINGAERVIVSQLHRSPGVVFEESTHPNGQRLISSRIIPVPRLVGRVHRRHPRRRLRPHRQEEEVPRDGAPARLRLRVELGHPPALLRRARSRPHEGAREPHGHPRGHRRDHRRGHRAAR